MSWDYPHFEKSAFAVWLGDWCEDVSPPDAVFGDRADAEAFIATKRREQFDAEAEDRAKYGGDLTAEDYYRDAFVMDVRNCYVPVWNSGDPMPEADPEPIPQDLGTVVPADAQFLAMFFLRLSLLLACLRNYQRTDAEPDLNGALALEPEVAAGLEKFNRFFREM